MKKTLICIAALTLLVGRVISQNTAAYKVSGLPVQFQYLADDFTVEDQGDNSWMAVAKGGEQYYIMLHKVSGRFNADSLRYLFMDLYSQQEGVENLQLNEAGSGNLGSLSGERVMITFMADGAYYNATAILIRFHINRQYNSFLLTYEMAERNQNNQSRYDAVRKGFEDLAASFTYTDYKQKKYFYKEDSVVAEYPDFWWAGVNDTCMQIDDGRCRITIKSYIAKDSTTTESYAKCERDKMKKSSALYPSFKGNFNQEKWRNDELATKFSGTYEYEEYGARKTWYFLKYIIRRKVDGEMKDFHVLFECPELYRESYYAGKFEAILKSLILPGAPGETKSK